MTDLDEPTPPTGETQHLASVPALDTPVPPVVAAAVVAACAELTNLTKDQVARVQHKDGGSHSYRYNDLADVVSLVRPVLARHGLCLIQPVARRLGGPVVIETWLLHESGHMLRWTFETPGTGDAQAVGSAITYGRRYMATACLGIASGDDDDDGRDATAADRASTVTPPRQARKAAPRAGGTKATPANQSPTMRAMFAVFRGLHIEDRDAQHKAAAEALGRPVESFTLLSDTELSEVVDWLKMRQRAEVEIADDTDGRAARWDDEMEARDRAGH